MNKILAVYNKKTGDLLFTQNGVQEEYACLTALVADNKEVIGVDLSTNSFILADRQATTEEKEQLKLQLDEKNKELEAKTQELADKEKQVETLNSQLTSSESENVALADAVLDLKANNLNN